MKKLNKNQILALAISCIVLVVIGATAVLVGTYVTGWSGFHFYDKPEEGDMKIACVGDSITYGFGVSDYGNKNYPKQLDTLLGDGYCVNNYGHSGATAQRNGDQPYCEYSEYKEMSMSDNKRVAYPLDFRGKKKKNVRSRRIINL